MKEKLYTIPVTDAFRVPCECPLCALKKQLETNALEFTAGSSYMEDDIRAQTDEQGFCEKHVRALFEYPNKLGLGLMLKTHLNKTIEDFEKLSKQSKPSAKSFFKKDTSSENPIASYVKKQTASCFICSRIKDTFERYLITVFHLYKNESEFRRVFQNSNGICMPHYGMLYELAPKYLNKSELGQFLSMLDAIYLENMKRVRDDVSWFVDKFDYRYADAPWKNSRDALPRAITKLNGFLSD